MMTCYLRNNYMQANLANSNSKKFNDVVLLYYTAVVIDNANAKLFLEL